MKRIFFVHLLNDYSGSPKVLSQVIAAVKQKHNVELFNGKSKEGFLTDCVEKHHQYYYKWFDNKLLTLVSFVLSQIFLFFKIINRRNFFDIIYINTMLPFGAALAGKFAGKEVIYHIHETSIKPEIFKHFLRWIIRKTADKIIYVSASLREEESFVDINDNIIFNCLDQKFLSKAEINLIEPKVAKGFNVLMICSLKAYKGVEEFVAVAKKCDGLGINFNLILNADSHQIEQYFSNSNLPSNLKIKGKQSDVHHFYANSNILLNLSRPDQWVETFGLTIIEAMAYGIPVIVPPVGGPAEIVRDGVEGFLISSYDTSSIVDKINELFNNKVKYDQLSKNAFKRASDFDEETFRKEILQVINE
jgi:glycosyltransferase involved in cell wall biosynthesis